MKLFAFVLVVLLTNSTHAFSIDGIRSGMTVDELQAYAARRGLDFRTQSNGIQHFIGNVAKYEIDGSFSSCNGKIVSYSRSVDPDTAYTNILNDMLTSNGQPKVSMQRLQVADRPGVYQSEVQMQWYVAGDRITLGMSPELRDGKGALVFRRGASIDYTVRSTCFKDF